jgi:hypothetical protein
MYEKKTNVKEFHHKVGRSKEYREEKSRLMKETRRKMIESGLVAKMKAEGALKFESKDPERAKELRKLRSIHFKLNHHQRCPFTMVDGIRREIQNMERYNTHSGVITEEEMRQISG